MMSWAQIEISAASSTLEEAHQLPHTVRLLLPDKHNWEET
jgi:hypothetical protein